MENGERPPSLQDNHEGGLNNMASIKHLLSVHPVNRR